MICSEEVREGWGVSYYTLQTLSDSVFGAFVGWRPLSQSVADASVDDKNNTEVCIGMHTSQLMNSYNRLGIMVSP